MPIPVELIINHKKPNQAIHRGQVLHLQPKQFTFLAVLAAAADAVVPDDVMYAELWADVVVNDERLYNIACRLRALGLPILRYGKTGYALDLPPNAVQVIQF